LRFLQSLHARMILSRGMAASLGHRFAGISDWDMPGPP